MVWLRTIHFLVARKEKEAPGPQYSLLEQVLNHLTCFYEVHLPNTLVLPNSTTTVGTKPSAPLLGGNSTIARVVSPSIRSNMGVCHVSDSEESSLYSSLGVASASKPLYFLAFFPG